MVKQKSEAVRMNKKVKSNICYLQQILIQIQRHRIKRMQKYITFRY